MKKSTYTFKIEHETTGVSLGEVTVQADGYYEAEDKMFAYLDSEQAPRSAFYAGVYERVENDQRIGVVELD